MSADDAHFEERCVAVAVDLLEELHAFGNVGSLHWRGRLVMEKGKVRNERSRNENAGEGVSAISHG